MAEAVVSFVVETIGNLLIEEGKSLSGVSDKVELLQSELNRMQSFLRDADARQNDEEMEMIKELVSRTKDLAFEADDLLETFALKVESRRRNGIMNILKRFACILNECYASHEVGTQIQKIEAKISDLNRSFQDCGLRALVEMEGSICREQQLRRIYSHVVEDDFVGLEDDVEKLVENLVDENEINHCRIISVYGMGGLGKTTIARKVYDHRQVRQHFNDFAWFAYHSTGKRKIFCKGS